MGSFRVGKEIKSFLYLFSARSLYSNIKFRAPQEATAIARAQYASHCDASVAFATEATRTKRSVACKILFYNIFTTFLYLFYSLNVIRIFKHVALRAHGRLKIKLKKLKK